MTMPRIKPKHMFLCVVAASLSIWGAVIGCVYLIAYYFFSGNA